MRIIDTTSLSGFARKTAEPAFASVVHNLIMDVRDSYRPGLHFIHPARNGTPSVSPWPGFDSEAVRRPGSTSYHRYM
jgi:hypothetical protein